MARPSLGRMAVKLTLREAEAGNYKLTIEDTGSPDCYGEIKVVV
jgi:hypothetical protein